MDNIKPMGKIFYLKNSFEGIMKRIDESPNPKKKLKKRPLFKDKKKAKALLDSRLARYAEAADVVIETEGKTTEMIVAEIIAAR